MAKRVCRIAGCPTIIPADAYRGLCDQHRRERDRARGTRQQRGYDAQHDAERARIQRDMDAGTAYRCCRCPEPIQPGQPWHLDHTADRHRWLGPAHDLCNLSAAGKASHG